ncbi:hypothetical protein D3C71_69830 [compost metagenome]
MHKENLFQLISKGDVVLWVGAGSSLYAGLPSGNMLSEFLFDGLSIKEKEHINKNLLLPDLAEEIYRIKGNNRNYIIQKLKEKILLNDFSSISTHENIAKIPHFRDIITTNYDQLFEVAYRSKLNLIYSDQQIPYIDNMKVNLYKIHGDLSVPDSVIITKSDYDNYFGNKKEEEVLWTMIKEKIATKSILFIGYNLEDSNVSVIFDSITKKLGANRKECFFVSPNVPPQKLYHLTDKKIHYIDSKGEDLLVELTQYLKDNIKKDYEKKMVSTEIYAEFLRNFNLKSDIEINESTNTIKNFSGVNGIPETIAEFVIDSTYPDIDKVMDAYKGEFIDELIIDKSAFKNLDLRMEGIKIADLNDIATLTVSPIPIFDKDVDISFENGYEINDIRVKVTRGGNRTKVLSEFQKNEFELIITFKENTILLYVDYRNSTLINNVSKQLQFYNAMNLLTIGNAINTFSECKLVFTSMEKFDRRILDGLKGLYDYNLFYLNYFEKLKEIEKEYNIRFSNIDINEVSDKNDRILNRIISKIRKEPVEEIFKGISFNIPLTERNKKLLADNENPTIKFAANMEKFTLHNQEFQLGEHDIHVVDPRILNYENVLKGIDEEIRIESNKEKILIKFKD